VEEIWFEVQSADAIVFRQACACAKLNSIWPPSTRFVPVVLIPLNPLAKTSL
jgi:hypothetical protein